MRRALPAWMLLLGLAWAGSALADYRTDYLNGRDAAKKGDWARTRELMQSALRQDGNPRARARLYGNIPEPYVPHYYLGLANARLGDCQAAVNAFENAAGKAVVAGLDELAPVQAKELAACRQTLAQQGEQKPPVVAVQDPPPVQDKPPVATGDRPPPPPPTGATPLSPQRIAPAQATLASVDRSIAGIEARLGKAPLAGTGDARAAARDLAKFKAERTQALADLERARKAGDAALLGRVEAGARALDGNVAKLSGQVDVAAKGLNEAIAARLLEARRKSIDSVLANLDARSREAGAAGLGADAVALRVAAEQRQALQAAKAASDSGSIERALERANAAIRGLEAAIAAAPKPAPEALRTLARAYLGADYTAAAKWNQLDQLGDDRARAQALLLRAAARWHVYMRGGAQDPGLFAAVETDLRKAKRLDPQMKPNTQAFSPKLLERYAAL